MLRLLPPGPGGHRRRPDEVPALQPSQQRQPAEERRAGERRGSHVHAGQGAVRRQHHAGRLPQAERAVRRSQRAALRHTRLQVRPQVQRFAAG